jgi:hypothetical protein
MFWKKKEIVEKAKEQQKEEEKTQLDGALENEEKPIKFEDKIKGIFDEWNVNYYSAEYKDYKVWIANGWNSFADYQGKPFLVCFSDEERKLLWKEFLNRRASKDRPKIFKEFGIEDEEKPKAKPKKKKE